MISSIQDILNKSPLGVTKYATGLKSSGEWHWWSSSAVAGKQEVSMRYEDNPTEIRTIMIVEIVNGDETETHRVDVNAVNSKSVTRVEMYALLAHQNKQSGESNVNFMKQMTLINYAASPENPAYTGNSSAGYYEERLNFDELLSGLSQDPDRASFISDKLIAGLLKLLAEYPKHEKKAELAGKPGAKASGDARWIM